MEKQFRLDNLEDAISALGDAIDAIVALGKTEVSDAECLRDIKRVYEAEAQEIRAEIEAEEAAEEAALVREYYGGLM